MRHTEKDREREREREREQECVKERERVRGKNKQYGWIYYVRHARKREGGRERDEACSLLFK